MRNLQEQVKKAFCYQKLFWPFTVWINCSLDLIFFANSRHSASNFKSFSQSLKQFFLTVGQNNFGNKIPFRPNFSWPKPKVGSSQGWAQAKSGSKTKMGPDWKWVPTESEPRPKVGFDRKWAPTEGGSQPKVGPDQKWVPTKMGPWSKVGPDQKWAPTESGPWLKRVLTKSGPRQEVAKIVFLLNSLNTKYFVSTNLL